MQRLLGAGRVIGLLSRGSLGRRGLRARSGLVEFGDLQEVLDAVGLRVGLCWQSRRPGGLGFGPPSP